VRLLDILSPLNSLFLSGFHGEVTRSGPERPEKPPFGTSRGNTSNDVADEEKAYMITVTRIIAKV
jgi:hypothetical protein